jgi:hypothetical protein
LHNKQISDQKFKLVKFQTQKTTHKSNSLVAVAVVVVSSGVCVVATLAHMLHVLAHIERLIEVV